MALRRDINKFAGALEKAVSSSIKGSVLKRLGDQMTDIIVERTRRGFGVKTTDGNRRPLRRLAKSTVEKRKTLKLASFTSPGKSNLTQSGRMLSSIKSRVRRGRILIRPSGSRGGGTTNQTVANHVSEDRPFLTLSRAELNKVVDLYEDGLDATLKKSLSRLRR